MGKQIDTVIVGGGQAGLALSYYLTQQGRNHTVLERGQVGESWRTQRWDSFTLVTPNWMTQLPGFAYQGDDPDGFMPREDFVNYLGQYARSFNAPLQCGVQVNSVRQRSGGNGYIVEADDRTLEAANVVLATGAYAKPKFPQGSGALTSNVYQLHSREYRNPQSLPSGAVLVVGTGQSGFQIAEELHESGRQVYLSTSSCARTPMRYRGQAVAWWLTRMGFFDRTLDQLPSPMAKFACNPHVSNRHGGKDKTLRDFAKEGMVLLGHVQAVQDKQISLAPDLEENLAKAEAFASMVRQMIDGFIMKTGTDAPAAEPNDESAEAIYAEPILTLDLTSRDINTIIWATGYRLDFDWVQIPVYDKVGYPIHQRGITDYPGLYFLGLHWLYKLKSALLYGIGEDAAFIASAIASEKKDAHLIV